MRNNVHIYEQHVQQERVEVEKELRKILLESCLSWEKNCQLFINCDGKEFARNNNEKDIGIP